jgi:hypothetical protein
VETVLALKVLLSGVLRLAQGREVNCLSTAGGTHPTPGVPGCASGFVGVVPHSVTDCSVAIAQCIHIKVYARRTPPLRRVQLLRRLGEARGEGVACPSRASAALRLEDGVEADVPASTSHRHASQWVCFCGNIAFGCGWAGREATAPPAAQRSSQ